LSERPADRVVGEVSTRGRVLVAEPYFEPGPALTLGRRGAVDAEPGELVAVEPDGRGHALLDEVLGRPDDPATVMHALAVGARPSHGRLRRRWVLRRSRDVTASTCAVSRP
jgi:hypothetical protein